MANNALREFKRQEQQRERDLEASIAYYARRKDELDAKRLQKEREFTAEKVAMREKMAATMERIYLQAHKDQETRLARDVAEAEEKADAYEAKQAALRAERIAEEKRSREAQMAAKAAAAEKRRQDRELYSERLKKKLQELKEEEEAEQAAIAARKVENHQFHPPLDIVDGAARIVDPIIAGVSSGVHVWGQFLKDYRPTYW